MDDQNKRVAPVKMDDRPSTVDRVKQAQDMMRRMEQQPAAKPTATAQVSRAQVATTARVAAVFDVGQVRSGGADIKAQPKSDPSVYAKAQVAPAKLFGGGADVELVGNPWKVISFETMLPVVFDSASKPGAQASVPDNAAKMDQGLLFPVKLESKGEQPVSRAVLTNEQGQLTGAECKNKGDLGKLLRGSNSIVDQLFSFAFGPEKAAGGKSKILDVAPSKSGAFADVTLSRNGETKTVSVNNFAKPIPEGMEPSRANIFVAQYFKDRFDAA